MFKKKIFCFYETLFMLQLKNSTRIWYQRQFLRENLKLILRPQVMDFSCGTLQKGLLQFDFSERQDLRQ